MKNLVIAVLFLFTVFNISGSTSSKNVRKAEKNYSVVAHRAIIRAKKTIELAKQNLINELKKELKRAMNRGDLESANAIQNRIKEIKARNKVEDFFKIPAKKNDNMMPFDIENVSPDSALEIKQGAKPWTNRKYTFLNIPKKLLGTKYFQYNAHSKQGIKISVKKNCLIRVIVGGSKVDLPAISKWEKEGWRINYSYNLRYNDRARNKLIILSKSVMAGQKIDMYDYSKFAGIIVLAN